MLNSGVWSIGFPPLGHEVPWIDIFCIYMQHHYMVMSYTFSIYIVLVYLYIHAISLSSMTSRIMHLLNSFGGIHGLSEACGGQHTFLTLFVDAHKSMEDTLDHLMGIWHS